MSNLLSGTDADAPVYAAKIILRDVLGARFDGGDWRVWQELAEETPSGVPLCSVRSLEVSDRAKTFASGIGREITIAGEIRVCGAPDSGGIMASGSSISLVDELSDALDAWGFKASLQTKEPTPERAELESLGIYEPVFGPRRETTTEEFKHVNRHAFKCVVNVGGTNG